MPIALTGLLVGPVAAGGFAALSAAPLGLLAALAVGYATMAIAEIVVAVWLERFGAPTRR